MSARLSLGMDRTYDNRNAERLVDEREQELESLRYTVKLLRRELAEARQQGTTRMDVHCAWCQKEGLPSLLRVVYHDGVATESHGMCQPHRDKFLAEVRQRMAESA
jgi:hypothetical protein